jgi:hypothetical protein
MLQETKQEKQSAEDIANKAQRLKRSPPVEEDLQKARALFKTLKSRRGTFKFASAYYETCYYVFMVPSLMLSSIMVVLGAIWPARWGEDWMKFTISILGALNAVLTSVASLLRYQSKADQYGGAAGQYDILVSELAFRLNYMIGVSQVELIQTLQDIGKKDLDIRNTVDPIPYWLEIKARLDTTATEKAKGVGKRDAMKEEYNTSRDPRKGSFVESTVMLHELQEKKLQAQKNNAGDELYAAESAHPPTENDVGKLKSLCKTFISRRGCYAYAALHYQKRVYLLMVPSLALSASTASLAGLGLSLEVYTAMVAVMNAVNTLLMSALSLLKYQSKMDAALSVAKQYDVLVSQLAFALKYLAGVKRGYVIGLIYDAKLADSEIRKTAILLPSKLELTARHTAKLVEASKNQGKADGTSSEVANKDNTETGIHLSKSGGELATSI